METRPYNTVHKNRSVGELLAAPDPSNPSDEQCSPLRTSPCLSLEGSETATAVLNDSPVGCQTRGVTEPQRDRGTTLVVDEV